MRFLTILFLLALWTQGCGPVTLDDEVDQPVDMWSNLPRVGHQTRCWDHGSYVTRVYLTEKYAHVIYTRGDRRLGRLLFRRLGSGDYEWALLHVDIGAELLRSNPALRRFVADHPEGFGSDVEKTTTKVGSPY